jgi:hypothetical protein
MRPLHALATLAACCTLAHAQKSDVPAKDPFPRFAAPATSSVQRSSPQALSSALVGSDSCTTPFVIAGTGTFPFDNTAATTGTQGQAEAICDLAAAGTTIVSDVWFTWTATTTGSATINTCGVSTIDTKIAVYAGAGCPTGAAIACNDDACATYQSTLTFPCTQGAQYTIQLGLYPGTAPVAVPGAGVFTLNVVVPSGNDDCASATALSGNGPWPFDNSGATTGTQGQAEGACLYFGGTALQKDLWYSWTAPASGAYAVTTCTTTSVDTKIAVYAGSGCPVASALACNDDACNLQTRTSFNAVQGQTYTFQLGLYYNSTLGGPGTFAVEVVPPPPANDDCATPLAINGAGPHAFNTTTSTTGTAGQGFTGCGTINKDLWYTWTASTTGPVVVTNCGLITSASTDTKIAVYAGSGCTAAAVAPLACNDDAGTANCAVQTLASWVTFNATCGSVYTIQVGNYSSTATTSIVGGFSITENGTPCVAGTAFCFGDGTAAVACPCGNAGAAGNGCASSINAFGANLAGSGSASLSSDTLVLAGSGMPNSNALYFQGTTQIAAAFGDGLRCAGGTVVRIGTKLNSAGASSYPGAGDLSVSVRGNVTVAGSVRNYQAWYRNAAAFCTPSTFNLTNGYSVTWTP